MESWLLCCQSVKEVLKSNRSRRRHIGWSLWTIFTSWRRLDDLSHVNLLCRKPASREWRHHGQQRVSIDPIQNRKCSSLGTSMCDPNLSSHTTPYRSCRVSFKTHCMRSRKQQAPTDSVWGGTWTLTLFCLNSMRESLLHSPVRPS